MRITYESPTKNAGGRRGKRVRALHPSSVNLGGCACPVGRLFVSWLGWQFQVFVTEFVWSSIGWNVDVSGPEDGVHNGLPKRFDLKVTVKVSQSRAVSSSSVRSLVCPANDNVLTFR